MKTDVLVRIALLLGVINLMITVTHMIHDMVEFGELRYHMDQAHPGIMK